MARVILTMGKPSNTHGAIDIIEEAVHLLLKAPLDILFFYYLGSLPFFLALLYFWGDMSRSAFAGNELTKASLGLAVLFIWMKFCQSLFAIKIHDHAAHTPSNKLGPLSLFHLLSFAAAIHASAVILLPSAFMAMLPFGWTYAFYQNCLVPDSAALGHPRQMIRNAIKNAAYAPTQNHMIILILFVFKLVVALNIGVMIYAVPQMLKRFFGIETVFTLGGFTALNSTFLATVVCLSHLCVDPLVKTVYALRCFYGASEKTGADLKAELMAIPKAVSPLILTGFLLISVLGYPHSAMGKTTDKQSLENAPTRTSLSPETLGKSINTVMSRREFTWRMPVETIKKNDEKGWADAFFDWLRPYLDKTVETVKRWWKALLGWLKKLFPDSKNPPVNPENKHRSPIVRYLLYGLVTLTLALLGILLFRMISASRKKPVSVMEHTNVTVDLTDETLKADVLPFSVWSHMAGELMEKGEYRLALRALYLGTLSRLAESGLITVASYKSNREYVSELKRRAHEKKDMLSLFDDTVTLFDGVWYGRQPIERDDVIRFSQNQERIFGHAL